MSRYPSESVARIDQQFAETPEERSERQARKRRAAAEESQPDRWRREAVGQLLELTKRWTTYEDIPESQKRECQEIGRRLWGLGGMNAMLQAYYAAKGANPAASTVQAYWDGVGDWRW